MKMSYFDELFGIQGHIDKIQRWLNRIDMTQVKWYYNIWNLWHCNYILLQYFSMMSLKLMFVNIQIIYSHLEGIMEIVWHRQKRTLTAQTILYHTVHFTIQDLPEAVNSHAAMDWIYQVWFVNIEKVLSIIYSSLYLFGTNIIRIFQ